MINIDNIVLYDWFSMTSKIDSADSIIRLLGLDKDNITWQHLNGRYGYKDRLSWNEIHILYNGRDDMGVCLEMSGQGCRAFEEYGVSDWSVLFQIILSDKDNYNLTRLDVAFDDHSGIININRMASDVLQENYVTVFKTRSMGVYYSGKGTTIYMGSNSSDVSFCVYDKARERNREDEGHWIRFEMHLSDEMAVSFIGLDMPVGEKFLGVVNRYIRFLKPNKSDSNKRRWSVAPWWLKFCNTLQKIYLYTPCNTDYNLAKCEDYVYRQSGNALDTLVKIKGIDTVLKELEERKPKPNIKYLSLIDANKNSNEILEILNDKKRVTS